LAVTSYALEDFCSFENIRKNGYGATKAVSGGGDYAVPYKITAEYSLKINKRTNQITEQCRLVIDSVTVLHGTTSRVPPYGTELASGSTAQPL
jgi:hypothetical protein